LLQNGYKTESDESLVSISMSDEAAYSELISRHLATVRRVARLYSTNLSDFDDLVSEGILGLMNAVKTYNGEREASFSTYAYSCVHNRIITAIRKSQRISRCEENIEGLELEGSQSPENIVISREELSEVFLWMENGLSKTEKSAFELYMSGASYQEIADKLGISLKSADNALARVRKKLRRKL